MKKAILSSFFILFLGSFFFFFRHEITQWSDQILHRVEKTVEQGVEFVAKIDSGALGTVIAPTPLRSIKDVDQSFLTTGGIIVATNSERALRGLPPLTDNAELRAAARAKVQDMFELQYFDHVSPDGSGPAALATTAGYDYIMIGENLAMGNFEDDQDLVTAWMNSPGHRENILHSRYTEIGVAAVEGVFEGNRVWLAVQEFGLPASACPLPSRELTLQKENVETKLSQLGSELSLRRDQLEKMEKDKRSREAYRESVEAYNALVEEFNGLVASLKSVVEAYNNEVRQYNACVAG